MKLISFSVKAYRSITTTPKLHIRPDLTVLIGPNNEGKSNMLRALVVAMTSLRTFNQMPPIPARSDSARGGGREVIRRYWNTGRSSPYNWKSDIPVGFKKDGSQAKSVFDLEFILTDSEIEEFRSEIGNNLNGSLMVRIGIGVNIVSFRVLKKGPAAQSLTRKASSIAIFISRRIDFQSIPAIRTAKEAENVINEIVSRELAVVEDDPAYQHAITKIADLQAPILSKISKTISDTLQRFIPDVADVKVELTDERRYRALRDASHVVVDDGHATRLSSKGDGVQSLAAISLIRHASKSGAGNRSLILAIEEPESHLHPRAIHDLYDVIREIANEHQTIITTHCPVFANRHDIGANIIVQRQKARPAASIAEIRDVLGVRVEDNLRNSEFVLLVEGEDDRRAIRSLLAASSPTLAAALDNRLGIDTLQGGANLSYKLSLLRMALCTVICLLDDDNAGRTAVEKALAENLIRPGYITLTRCKNLPNAELEDWYDPCIYQEYIDSKFPGVLQSQFYIEHRDKWSNRLKAAAEKMGRPWNDLIEAAIKRDVSELVARSPQSALLQRRRVPFDALVKLLEGLLGSGHA